VRANQYSAEIFRKDGEEYTKFVIGNKVRPKIFDLVIALGGTMVKSTKQFKHYEVKGNKLHVMMVL
jgi:shikimate kinase